MPRWISRADTLTFSAPVRPDPYEPVWPERHRWTFHHSLRDLPHPTVFGGWDSSTQASVFVGVIDSAGNLVVGVTYATHPGRRLARFFDWLDRRR